MGGCLFSTQGYLFSVLLLLLILILFTALLYVLTQCLRLVFFYLDLFFCAISRANERARTFAYSFIIETRTFFVNLNVALISALETCFHGKCFLKSVFMYEMFLTQKQNHQPIFFYNVFLDPNCKILLYNKKYFLHILDDDPRFCIFLTFKVFCKYNPQDIAILNFLHRYQSSE